METERCKDFTIFVSLRFLFNHISTKLAYHNRRFCFIATHSELLPENKKLHIFRIEYPIYYYIRIRIIITAIACISVTTTLKKRC